MAGKRSSGQRRKPTDKPAKAFLGRAKELGALGARLIDPHTVVTGDWVRWKCQFGCDGFRSSLMCPPHSPTPAQTRSLLDEYRRGVLFEAPRGEAKSIAATLEREVFLSGYYRAFGLGSGPCRLCPTCAFDQGCRHAYEARPSMEACGIDVYATARKHGFTINVVRDHGDEQHYYGLVLVD